MRGQREAIEDVKPLGITRALCPRDDVAGAQQGAVDDANYSRGLRRWLAHLHESPIDWAIFGIRREAVLSVKKSFRPQVEALEAQKGSFLWTVQLVHTTDVV